MTSSFGVRCRDGTGAFHAGIDVRIWETRNIVAVAPGTVYRVAWWGIDYNWTIILKHISGSLVWYTGYHHIDSLAHIRVKANDIVTEGQLIGLAGSNHLHFNYWLDYSDELDDDNSLHPLRLLGGGGNFWIQVSCPCTPVSVLRVDHMGQLVETGVGVGYSPYGTPYYTYVWNLEGNVRAYTETFFEYGIYTPGNCYLGLDTRTGISPTSFDASSGTQTYYTFRAYYGDWILDNPCYTYAKSVDGTSITIQRPVSDLFQEVVGGVSEIGVTVRWEVSFENMEASDFIVYRGVSREELYVFDVDVTKETPKSFQFIDGDVEKASTYYYQVAWCDDDRSISTGIIEVSIPGVNAIFLDAPYPNPFKERISANCGVPTGNEFELAVYDVRGALITTIQKERSQQNEFPVVWDGTNAKGEKLASGCYFFKLAVKGQAPIMKKIILLE